MLNTEIRIYNTIYELENTEIKEVKENDIRKTIKMLKIFNALFFLNNTLDFYDVFDVEEMEIIERTLI